MSQILNDMKFLKSTSKPISHKLKKVLFLLIFFSTLTATEVIGQFCCRGAENSTGPVRTWCLTTSSACNTGTNCTEAILEAAYGTGDITWLAVQCITGNGSGGTCASSNCNQPLPVELVEFDVTYADKGLQINWVTASETDNDRFEIERSADGLEWSVIQIVAGNGTSLNYNYYDHLDQSPLEGFNYYRLRQVDYDDAWSYSPVKVAVWQGSNDPNKMKLTVLPNPAADWMTVGLTASMDIDDDIQFEIYDLTGKLVRSVFRSKYDKIRISLDGLPSGYYVLNARQGRIQETTRFIKK